MNFQHDLAEISRELMRSTGTTVLEEWDDHYACIKYLELHHRWFDSSVPYEVVFSEELLERIPKLTGEEQTTIRDIVSCLKNCVAITPYMSKGIRDTDVHKSDFLLKNWDIYHLHLEKAVPGKPFTKPNLLFFQCKGNVVYLIDVRKHPKGSEWFIRELLEIVYDNWPSLLHYFPDCRPIEAVEDRCVHDALKSMVVAIPFRDGMLMPTTLGVAISGDSSMAVIQSNRILNRLKLCERELNENEETIRKMIQDSIGIQISAPLDYKLIVENGYFVAFEMHSNIKIRLFETN